MSNPIRNQRRISGPTQAAAVICRDRLGRETLTSRSKDLLVAAQLTEAWVKMRGFAGLRDGLALLRGLVEQCWDRVSPVIDDGDLSVRAGPFNWLADPIKGACFPTTVRNVTFVGPDQGQRYSALDWSRLSDSKAKLTYTREDIDKAITATSQNAIEEDAACLAQSREHLCKLVEALNGKYSTKRPA